MVIFPNETISRHWRGALQASLRRAPLETFLRFRDLKVAPRGPACDTDNISRATIFMLSQSLADSSGMRALDAHQCALIGQLTCSLCDHLAQLIAAPTAWRVAALISTTRLMPRTLGLLDAAKIAAAAAREFCDRPLGLVDAHRHVGRLAAEAVAQNDNRLLHTLSVRIAHLLADAARIYVLPLEYSPATSNA
jgi:hypothetical protein